MRFVVRTLQRGAVLGLGVLSVWLIAFVFRWVDSSLPSILALSVTVHAKDFLRRATGQNNPWRPKLILMALPTAPLLADYSPNV